MAKLLFAYGKLVVVLLSTLLASCCAQAQSIIASKAFEGLATGFGHVEVSVGVDAARDQWIVYSNLTSAPWGGSLYSDGWRLRLGGGYGQFGYDASHPIGLPCGSPTSDPCRYLRHHYTVDQSYAEALFGYSQQLGSVTAKAFAGAAMTSQKHRTIEPGNGYDGVRYGGKVALELWYDVSAHVWTSLDASYATSRDETSARWRGGWRMGSSLSIGPELRYDKNIETAEGYWNGRVGLFARYEWDKGEVSLAGGHTTVADGARSLEWSSPYATLNMLWHY
jgi:hypothetical protein